MAAISSFVFSLDDTNVIITVVCALVCVAAAFFWRAVGSSSSSNVPLLPGGHFLTGHASEILRNLPRLHDWYLESARLMDFKTYRFSVPTLPPFIFVYDPACLQHMLKTQHSSFVKGKVFQRNFEPILGHGIFSSDGQQWLWKRKLAAHVFNIKSFKQYINIVFAEKMQLLTQLLSRAAGSGGVIDLHDLMYRFTLDSFGQIGFGTNIGSLTCEGTVPFAAAFDRLQVVVLRRCLTPGWPLLELLDGTRWRVARDSTTIRQLALDVINKRRHQQQQQPLATATAPAAPAAEPEAAAHGSTAGAGSAGDGPGAGRDLLSLFLEAQGPDGKPLSDKQLVDTVLNFIIAGRDTTAQALSWTFYELMQHPELEAQVVEEVRAVPGLEADSSADAPLQPSYEQLCQLRYTRACFLEALRLHPSVPGNIKFAAEHVTLPDGSIVPKGALVAFCPYVVNRMPSFWGADADSFRPERWLEMESMPSPYSYLTFNAGPRLCLGQRLAEIEGVYVLAGLLARFRFEQAVPGERVTYAVSATLPLKGGLKVLVEARK